MMISLPDKAKPIEEQDPDVLFAMLIWGESRGEVGIGKDAVAHVVLNRVALAPHYGADLPGVILKAWAFSSFNPNDPNRAKLLEPLAHGSVLTWQACVITVVNALDGVTQDPTGGATHYCTIDLFRRPAPEGRDPEWFEAPEVDAGHTVETARIGGHVFCKAA